MQMNQARELEIRDIRMFCFRFEEHTGFGGCNWQVEMLYVYATNRKEARC